MSTSLSSVIDESYSKREPILLVVVMSAKNAGLVAHLARPQWGSLRINSLATRLVASLGFMVAPGGHTTTPVTRPS
jgi:hypothetical protein